MENNMKINYHTHCEKCKHAIGTVADYAQAAYEAGYNILGISDHAPFKGDMFGYRMDFLELNDYIEEVKKVQNQYMGRMDIKLGMEVEFLKEQQSFYEELLGKYEMDYLILGQHFYDKDDKVRYVHEIASTSEYIDYAHSIKEAISKGYFFFIAHPDLIFIHDFPWDDYCVKACDIIIDAAVKYNVPIELNANGVRRGLQQFCDGERYQYPHYKFFQMVSQSKVPVLVNSDCHNPNEIDDEAMEQARKLVLDWNLNLYC